MACKCMENALDKTLKLKEEQHPDWKIEDIDWVNKGYNFSDKGNPINLSNEIKIEYTFTKVDGSTSKSKVEKLTIYGTYCTFCGKKFEEDAAG